MSSPHRSTFVLGLAAALLAPQCALAQTDLDQRQIVPVVAGATVTEDELGRPIAIGPDWECEFDTAGARFLPVLGSMSPVLMDLRLRAASVRRGAEELTLTADAEPAVHGDRVSYRRSPGVVEHFDALPAGLEHSLVLERPIAGSGDLVVRIALAGEAAEHGGPTAHGGLCFTQGQGGIDYGALTAIAADGERCQGKLRLEAGAIEWVVPAAFVDRAAYPLVLDPLVGTNFQITFPIGGPFAGPWQFDLFGDVAYDLSNDRYLVVWERRYSSGGAGQSSIRAQRLDGNGAPIGSVLPISLVDTSRSPGVTNVNQSNRFVVSWVYADFFATSQVRMRSVAASDGTLSATGLVATQNTGDIMDCDVAGESSTGSSVAAQAWIVWASASQGLRLARVSVPPNSTSLTLAGTFAIAPPTANLRLPRISRSPTANGRLGIAWLSGPSTGSGVQVRAAVIDRSGAVVNGATLVFSTTEWLSAPAIDGGSGATATEFVVAFETHTLVIGSNFLSTLYAVPLTSAAQLGVGAPIVLSSETNNAFTPAVGWRPGKAYVAYSTLLNTRIVLRGVDSRTCATCEPETIVSQVTTGRVARPSICMDRTGGTSLASTGLLVWDQQSSTIFEGSIRGRFLDAFSPAASTTSLGGGCGFGGTITTNSPPAVGNGSFQMRLLQPGPTALFAVLNLTSSSAPPTACGACQWLPFENSIALPVSQPLTIVPVPIPCSLGLVGTGLDTQWTVWKPGTAPCAFAPDFALSNILRLNLQ